MSTEVSTGTNATMGSETTNCLIKAVPFGVKLSSSTLQRFDEPEPVHGDDAVVAMMGESGIVGSVVIMGQKSAMIWVGWGQLDLVSTSSSSPPPSSSSSSRFGSGAPTMGQLTCAMPRTTYRGAFGGGSSASLGRGRGVGGEPSTSQLIGSASSEDQMLGDQMASRLSTKSGRAIFVSCQLSQTPSSVMGGGGPDTGPGGSNGPDGGWSAGLDSEMIAHRAAALAEKKVWQILQEHTA